MIAYLRLLCRNLLAMAHPRVFQKEGKPKWMGYILYALCAAGALALYAMMVWLELKVFDLAVSFGQPKALLAFLFFGATVTCLIFGLLQVVASLFFSKDTAFLAALPISSGSILRAKMLLVILSESALVLAISLPLTIRYGLYASMNLWYYIGMILGSIAIPAVPITLMTCISFLLIRVSGLWKRRESVTTIAIFALIIGSVYLQMMINMNVAKGQMDTLLLSFFTGNFSLVNMITDYYPPLRGLMAFTEPSAPYALLQGFGFIALSVAAFIGISMLLGRAYMPLALKQNETMQRLNAQEKHVKGKDKQRSPFWALYRLEMRSIFQSPAYATNCLAGVIMCPLMVFVFCMSIFSQEGGKDELLQLMNELPSDIYLMGALSLFLIACLFAIAVGTAVSREGQTMAHRRTFPVPATTALNAKLLMGLVLNGLAVMPCAVGFMVIFPQWIATTIVALLSSQLFSLCICLIYLIMDTYFPKLLWKTETEAVKKNVNTLFAMLINMVFISLIGFAFWFVAFDQGAGIYTGFAVMNVITLLLCVLLYLWFYTKVSKVYATKTYQS